MINLLGSIFHFVSLYGMVGVFLIMILENIGLPIPTEIGFLVAQELVNKNIVNFYLAVTIITLGHQVGSLISYWLGISGRHWIVNKLRHNQRLIKTEQKVTYWYQKYGIATVLLGRWIGYIRPWSSFLAGVGGFPFWPFFILTLIGSFLWNFVQMLFSKILILFWQRYGQLHLVIGIILFLAFFGVIIYEFLGFKWKKSKLFMKTKI